MNFPPCPSLFCAPHISYALIMWLIVPRYSAWLPFLRAEIVQWLSVPLIESRDTSLWNGLGSHKPVPFGNSAMKENLGIQDQGAIRVDGD